MFTWLSIYIPTLSVLKCNFTFAGFRSFLIQFKRAPNMRRVGGIVWLKFYSYGHNILKLFSCRYMLSRVYVDLETLWHIYCDLSIQMFCRCRLSSISNCLTFDHYGTMLQCIRNRHASKLACSIKYVTELLFL